MAKLSTAILVEVSIPTKPAFSLRIESCINDSPGSLTRTKNRERLERAVEVALSTN